MARSAHKLKVLLLLPFISGCAAVPFEQNQPPVPLMTRQGEFEASGGVHFPYASGFDFKEAYAMSSHLAEYAGFQIDKGSAVEISEAPPPVEPDYNNRFFEVGLGYFDSLPQMHYEAYLLLGYGSGAEHQKAWWSNPTDTNTLRVFRLGIQQNIGTKSSAETFGVGLGTGFERLFGIQKYATNYDYIRTGPGTDTSIATSSLTYPAPQSAFYVEPVLFWSFGFPLGENEPWALRFLTELWVTYTSNSYSLFGGGNASFTVSLDF